MEKLALVSIISGQVVPIIQFILENNSKENLDHIFISTERMQKKNEYIIEACGLNKEKVEIIEIDPYNPQSIQETLNEKSQLFNEYDKLFLNITGGTKLTTIVSYSFFKDRAAEIYYFPNQLKYWKLFPLPMKEIEVQNKLDLITYLKAHGFKFNDLKQPKKDFDTAKMIYEFFMNNDIEHYKLALEKIRAKRDKSLVLTEKDHDIKEFLEAINYNFSNNKLSRKDTKYLSGDWFEEYVYYKVKKALNLEENFITVGTHLKRENESASAENEFDVLFIYQNKLHFIECKTSIEKDWFNDAVYKIDSLRHKFGLFAQSYLFTLGKRQEEMKKNFERAEMNKIKVVTKEDFVQGIDFNKFFTHAH